MALLGHNELTSQWWVTPWGVTVMLSTRAECIIQGYQKWDQGSNKLLWNQHFRADPRFVSSQWETALLCNNVSHWLGTSLESTLGFAVQNICCIWSGWYPTLYGPYFHEETWKDIFLHHSSTMKRCKLFKFTPKEVRDVHMAYSLTAADDLVMKGAKASATIILTQVCPEFSPERLTHCPLDKMVVNLGIFEMIFMAQDVSIVNSVNSLWPKLIPTRVNIGSRSLQIWPINFLHSIIFQVFNTFDIQMRNQ